MAKQAHPDFSGWTVCAAGAGTQAMAIGFTLGAVGVFAAPLGRELGVSSTQFNLAVGLFTLVMNLSMPWVGGLLDRTSIKRVMLMGAAILSLSLAGLSQARSIWQVGFLFSVGCAIGMAMLGPMASSTAMANWFSRLRGRALGIANAGGPLGPALIVPVAAYTISRFGWRETLLGFAALTACVGLPLVYFWIIDRPSDVDQYPDGEEPAEMSREELSCLSEVELWGTSSILRSRDFWLMALGMAPFACSGLVMGANAIPYMSHLGASTEFAALVVVSQSVGAVVGPLTLGSLADRVHPRSLFLSMILVLGIGVGLLAVSLDHYVALGLFFVIGFVGGSMMPVYGALVAKLFGPESFGQVLGLGALVGVPVLFLGPVGFGYAFDSTGSYVSGFIGLIVSVFMGAGALTMLPHAKARRASVL